MDYINAFWVGGLICALVQILLEKSSAIWRHLFSIQKCGNNNFVNV